MKERPILFSGPMVTAILEGRKTQTRRTLKPAFQALTEFDAPQPSGFNGYIYGELHSCITCPHGVPGDRLWVRETWRPKPWAKDRHSHPDVAYRADDSGSVNQNSPNAVALQKMLPPWKPSIFMPRWASRITLEITDVRVQRLQDISEEDARAEGCDGKGPVGYIPSKIEMGYCRYDYRQLWNEINGKRAPWDSNPWVWAISFKQARDSARGVA